MVHEILKAVKAVDRMFDEEERSIYETRMQSMAEMKSKIASAEEKWMKIGMKIGMEKGMEKGLEKGLKRMKQEKLNIAKPLLEVLYLETVALKTGLSVDEAEKLKRYIFCE
jgi:flagellar biosynthesis/type III secretory pathway protein FliH